MKPAVKETANEIEEDDDSGSDGFDDMEEIPFPLPKEISLPTVPSLNVVINKFSG